ncbi:hypothetical protein AX774_g3280 [Zancudomyces culisetae]|nr:hypothetical protein AX774_g3280 [Zancudomyces culisetae]|eukprot:OMH83205.1 hypothetical protein AX774_g3280 [Zancudomyces culisetae]
MERNSKEDVEPSVNLLTGLRAHVNSMYAEFLKAKDSTADTSLKKSATGGLKFTDLDRLKSEVEEIVTKINEMNIGESKTLVKKSNKNSISSINSVGNEENQLIDSKKFVDAVYSSGNEIPKLSELKTHLSGGLRQKIRVNKSHYIHLYRRIKKYKLEDKFGKTFEFGNEISSEIETEIIHGVARDPEGDKKSTEAFLQQNIDVILGPVFKALKLHNPGFTYNRNSAEVSMTKGKLRPDYCLTYLNKMLVFKGEEKKKGSVRKIAQELTDKMKENKIGIPHHLPYMLGYATAGYNVLLVAIDHTNELIEVSDILDIRKLTDRITLMQSLLNISIIFSQMTKDLNFC